MLKPIPHLTSHLLPDFLTRFRDDLDALRSRCGLVRHVLIESTSEDRERLLLKQTESGKMLPQRWMHSIEDDEQRQLDAVYLSPSAIHEFDQLMRRGSTLLRSTDPVVLRLSFGRLALPPHYWAVSWCTFVHVMCWHKVLGSQLKAERWTISSERQWTSLEHILRVRDGTSQPLDSANYEAVADPPDWCSVIDDFLGASLSAVALIDVARRVEGGGESPVDKESERLPPDSDELPGLFDWPKFEPDRLEVRWRGKACRFRPKQERRFRLLMRIVEGRGAWISHSRLCDIDDGVWTKTVPTAECVRTSLANLKRVLRAQGMDALADAMHSRTQEDEIGVFVDAQTLYLADAISSA